MKRHFFITITALMAVMVSSCKKDNDELDNPNGPWSVELTAECTSPNQSNYRFYIEIAGTGTVTIDWGDGTVLENFQMPELKKFNYNEENFEGEGFIGKEYTHIYDKAGTYSVKVFGQSGAITLLGAYCDYNVNHFSSLILHQCGQLQSLNCGGSFSSLDLNKCPLLKDLTVGSDYLTSLDLSKCTQLEQFFLIDTPIPSIDVSRCTQLKTLYTEGTDLISLNISGCSQLKELECGSNSLTSLDVSKCTKLEYLDCSGNQLTTLDVSKCTKLERLACDENKLTTLDANGCTRLERLYCHQNQLTTLNASRCTQLEELWCYKNKLTSLNVSKCTQLKELRCSENRLSVVVMNQIYNDLPIVGQGMGYISVDKATAGDYYIAENKGWRVSKY